MNRKLVSIVTPCYNEQDNVEELCSRVKREFDKLPDYDYEHLFVDNASDDHTVDILRRLAARDSRVKLIVNARNFGHIRSHVHGLLQARGDAIISMVADLQDPPELIPDFLKRWEAGSEVVVGVKRTSHESRIMFRIRKIYYSLLDDISEVRQIRNFTGFGLFGRRFIELVRELGEPYPYFRGLVAEFGVDVARIEYDQPVRTKGKTKNNFFTLYDMAVTGFVNHTKLPLRLAGFVGFSVAAVSLIISTIYFIMKLINWNGFQLGSAPVIIGLFFFAAVQLIFIGVIGEYVGAIYTQVKSRPLVIERERINFGRARNRASQTPR